MRRLVPAVVITVVSACGGKQPPTELPPATDVPFRSAPAGSVAPVVAVGGAVRSAPNLPPEAKQVAADYAAATLSYRFDAGPSAWVNAVAPICTTSWLERLRSERTAPGDWAGVVERREVAAASVLAVHPSAGVGEARRAVVAVRVDISGEVPSRRTKVVELDLVTSGGRWLVAGDG